MPRRRPRALVIQRATWNRICYNSRQLLGRPGGRQPCHTFATDSPRLGLAVACAILAFEGADRAIR